MVTALETSNFDQLVLSEGIVLIDCWAPWCQACKDFTPVFEAAAADYSQHRFASLNTRDQDVLTRKLKVSHIPTLILFRDGLLLLRQPGHLGRNEIDEVIGKAEGLDMDAVRRDMENRQRHETA